MALSKLSLGQGLLLCSPHTLSLIKLLLPGLILLCLSDGLPLPLVLVILLGAALFGCFAPFLLLLSTW